MQIISYPVKSYYVLLLYHKHLSFHLLYILLTFVIAKILLITIVILFLDFIREFLFKLGELQPTDKTHSVCQLAYNNTLAQFHPWIVRKGAVVAMYALPTREQLLKKVCLDVEKAILILPDMLAVTKNVYDRTQKLFSDFDLHDLP